MFEEIKDERLQLEDLPSSSDPQAIFSFAMTFNGYEYFGSFEECAAQANAGHRDSLTSLRNELFFVARGSHHSDSDDYVGLYEEILPRLTILIRERDLPKPPRMLSGNKVLEYAFFDESVTKTPFGKRIIRVDPNPEPPLFGLAICQNFDSSLPDDVYYLYYCIEDWEIDSSQAWNWPGGGPTATSTADVRDHAERVYEGLAGKWRTLTNPSRSNSRRSLMRKIRNFFVRE